jgi:hypothetical protein
MDRHDIILVQALESDIRACEIQATARRQFSLSIVVAVAVGLVAAPAAMGPHRHQEAASSARHQFAVVRTPTFVTPRPERVATPERLASLSEDRRPQTSTEAPVPK